ncbi:MAG: FkbM family methyltransferase [Thermoproteaceae archaeon]|nr:FkbM family methyltransferase [Thermoproteaceae archaeon]
MAPVRGLKLTLRSLGPKWAAREIIRRVAGRPYTYNGILVRDSATFRVIRALASRGSVWRQGDRVFFRNKLGTFAVSYEDIQLLRTLADEDFEAMYGYLNVKGKTVADIGAYLGETAVLFARMGARHVHAYEPLFFKYVELNLALNNITNATVHPYGVSVEEDTYGIAAAGPSSGLLAGSTRIRVVPVEEAIADVVKMDCEGCEWNLLSVPCAVIKRAEEYAIEIHGPEPLLVRKLEKCGFSAKLHARLAPQVSIWHFRSLQG